MNGKRVKQLRDSFLAEYGYAPSKSEFKRYKKNFTRNNVIPVDHIKITKQQQEYVTSFREA